MSCTTLVVMAVLRAMAVDTKLRCDTFHSGNDTAAEIRENAKLLCRARGEMPRSWLKSVGFNEPETQFLLVI